MHSKGGYTAVELLVVMAVTSLVAAIGAVNYADQIPRYRLREASRELVSQLRILRHKAIISGVRNTVFFPLPPNQQRFYETFSPWPIPERHIDLPPPIRFGVPEGLTTNKKGDNIPQDGIALAFSSANTGFNPNGLPTLNGRIYLTNAPAGKEAVAIIIHSTGRIRTEKYDGQAWR